MKKRYDFNAIKANIAKDYLASNPGIQAEFVQPIAVQDNSAQFIGEINSLKNLLQQKDSLIEKLHMEKQELATKLAASENHNLLLTRESIELRADKLDLRNDKSRLNEEVLDLKQSNLAKALEIEQLKKEFAEFSLINSSQLEAHNIAGDQVPNPLIGNDTTHSILLEAEESVVLGDSIHSVENP